MASICLKGTITVALSQRVLAPLDRRDHNKRATGYTGRAVAIAPEQRSGRQAPGQLLPRERKPPSRRSRTAASHSRHEAVAPALIWLADPWSVDVLGTTVVRFTGRRSDPRSCDAELDHGCRHRRGASRRPELCGGYQPPGAVDERSSARSYAGRSKSLVR